MKISRWTFGIMLAAAVSLWGLVDATASPFSMFILADDLGNRVNGSAPDQGEWEGHGADSETGPGGDSSGTPGDDSDSEDSDGGSGGGDSASGGGSDSGNGNGNNGHGNNEDGVDSSNPSQGHGGPNGQADESCDGSGECVDDESGGGSSGGGSGSSKNKK